MPVPQLRDLAELNALLLAGCEQDLGRRIDGRPVTVGEAWALERPLLRALPAEPFDACETAAPRVDSKSLVTIRQNRYSVPVALAGLKVAARIGAREITINHDGREVARHERLHGKFGDQRPARSLPRAAAAQARRARALARAAPGARPGRAGLSASIELWAGLTEPLRTLGRRPADGRRAAALPRARTRRASSSRSAARSPPARSTVAPSRCSPAARRAPRRAAPAPLTGLDARLAAHERPAPDLADYDQLLGGAR